MAKIASEIRAINRHLDALESAFGVESIEYQNALKTIQFQFKHYPGAIITTKTGKTHVSSGKKVVDASRNIGNVREIYKRQGSVKDLKQKYRDENPDITTEEIKEKAHELFLEKTESENYYKDHYAEIQDDPEILAKWKQRGLQEGENYDIAVAFMEKKRAEKERQKSESKRETATFKRVKKRKRK